MPVPDNGIDNSVAPLPDPLAVVSVSVALNGPGSTGEKVTLMTQIWPANRVEPQLLWAAKGAVTCS